MADEVHKSDCVLIVDGDVLARHAIADYLRDCGYIVVEAASTDEARVALLEPALKVDTVICAADAPGSANAFQFRAWASQLAPSADVALAGNVERAAEKAADLCEEGPSLARPYDPKSVVDHIRRLQGRFRSKTMGAAS